MTMKRKVWGYVVTLLILHESRKMARTGPVNRRLLVPDLTENLRETWVWKHLRCQRNTGTVSQEWGLMRWRNHTSKQLEIVNSEKCVSSLDHKGDLLPLGKHMGPWKWSFLAIHHHNKNRRCLSFSSYRCRPLGKWVPNGIHDILCVKERCMYVVSVCIRWYCD